MFNTFWAGTKKFSERSASSMYVKKSGKNLICRMGQFHPYPVFNIQREYTLCRDLSLATSLFKNKIYWPIKKVSKMKPTKQKILLNQVQFLTVLPNNYTVLPIRYYLITITIRLRQIIFCLGPQFPHLQNEGV